MENKMSTPISTKILYPTCTLSIYGSEGSEAGRKLKKVTVSFAPGAISPERFEEFMTDLRAGKPNPQVSADVIKSSSFYAKYEKNSSNYGVFFDEYMGKYRKITCRKEHHIIIKVNE
jgi:hypothetical protein